MAVVGHGRRVCVAVNVHGDAGRDLRSFLALDPLQPTLAFKLLEPFRDQDITADVIVTVASLAYSQLWPTAPHAAHATDRRLVVMYDDPDEAAFLAAIQRWHASAYVALDSSALDVAHAIRMVADDGILMPAALWERTRTWATAIQPGLASLKFRKRVTPAELRTLKALADGRTNRQIATKLHVSPATVRFHLSNLMSKLGCETRGELIAVTLRAGLVMPAKD